MFRLQQHTTNKKTAVPTPALPRRISLQPVHKNLPQTTQLQTARHQPHEKQTLSLRHLWTTVQVLHKHDPSPKEARRSRSQMSVLRGTSRNGCAARKAFGAGAFPPERIRLRSLREEVFQTTQSDVALAHTHRREETYV